MGAQFVAVLVHGEGEGDDAHVEGGGEDVACARREGVVRGPRVVVVVEEGEVPCAGAEGVEGGAEGGVMG